LNKNLQEINAYFTSFLQFLPVLYLIFILIHQ